MQTWRSQRSLCSYLPFDKAWQAPFQVQSLMWPQSRLPPSAAGTETSRWALWFAAFFRSAVQKKRVIKPLVLPWYGRRDLNPHALRHWSLNPRPVMVRTEGLEPPRLAAVGPKPTASAISPRPRATGYPENGTMTPRDDTILSRPQGACCSWILSSCAFLELSNATSPLKPADVKWTYPMAVSMRRCPAQSRTLAR